MNIRIVALGLVFAVSLALAQEFPKPAKVEIGERSAMLQTLQRGKQITAGREQYRHLPEVFAAERKGDQTQQHALDAVGAGTAQVLETKGRLVLYRGSAAKSALVARVGASNVYPTVVNVRTGALGVLTGTLVVKPKNMGDAASIASQHGLETVKEFAHIGTVFYRAKANADIADLAAALQADSRVENAYPEIIEHVRRPK
jgi:hypothetical protein